MALALSQNQDLTRNARYTMILYAGGSILAFESSPNSGYSLGTYNPGDVFKLRVASTGVQYMVNGSVRRTAPFYDGSTPSYYAQFTLISLGATVDIMGFVSSRQGIAGPTGSNGPTGMTGPTGFTGPGGGASPITVLEATGTSQTLSSSNYNTYFYLTNSGFNAVTLPSSTPTSAGGNFWALRNATNTSISITLTNTLNLTSPLIIPSSNTQTLAISGATSNTILLL